MAARARRLEWLRGGGVMSDLVESFDWSKSPLGRIETWSQSLRTTVSLCIASTLPINIIWGDEHTQIYNDGYRLVCGAVHPRALGEDYRVTWTSAWPAVGQPFERALAGETTFLENQRMFLDRNGYLEETFFTFSLSPIRDESGKVVGLFHPVTETTHAMLAQRRTSLLRAIADSARCATALDSACDRLVETLGEYGFDVPFSLLYLTTEDSRRATLRRASGTPAGGALAQESVPLTEEGANWWPLRDAMHGGGLLRVTDVITRFGSATAGPYPDPVSTAFVWPIRVAGLELPLGFLVVGASPRLPLDEAYASFFEMLGGATSAALGNARGFGAERRRVESLAELDRESEGVIRAKSSFLRLVSHELRTPLAALRLQLTRLTRARGDMRMSTAQGDVLARMASTTTRLTELVESVLAYARVESGHWNPQPEAFDAAELVRDVVDELRPEIRDKPLTLNMHPCAEKRLDMVSDPRLVRLVLGNLVANAIKFSDHGRVDVSVARSGNRFRFVVQDTGPGIPREQRGRIFEPFEQLAQVESKHVQGFGLGLALAKEMVGVLKGQIDLRSVVGAGSTFVVSLPATTEAS